LEIAAITVALGTSVTVPFILNISLFSPLFEQIMSQMLKKVKPAPSTFTVEI
jgi:hypothetical protein